MSIRVAGWAAKPRYQSLFFSVVDGNIDKVDHTAGNYH
jgi:hypothetical protein